MNILRSSSLLRRACTVQQRRLLHGDSSSRGSGNGFMAFSVMNPQSVDPRFGMDMTHAPGYELAVDEDPPAVGNQKLVEFAVRHARLSSSDVAHSAPGYIWVGNVLYPSGIAPDGQLAFSWEITDFEEEKDEHEEDDEEEVDEQDGLHAAAATTTTTTTNNNNQQKKLVQQQQKQQDDNDETNSVQAKRRFTGGQARRIRKERERNAIKRARRVRKPRPLRKPENDIPPEDQ